MQLLIILFGFASLAGAAVFVLSLVVGTGLCLTRRFRSVGVFVLLVPTISAAMAFVGSWSLAAPANRRRRPPNHSRRRSSG